MKHFAGIIAVVFLMPMMVLGQAKMETKMDSISYALGMDVGSNLGQLGLDLSSDLIYQGVKDALMEADPSLTEAEQKALLASFQQIANEAYMKMMQEKAAAAKAKGEEFLTQNQDAEGVQTTASGLQYKVIEAGTGAQPTVQSTVKVHYEGTLIDGKVFDSSYERGTPIEFGVMVVIPGWTEGLQLMKTGAKFQFFIPSNLAYGERGSPPSIGPNETLIFTVELLEVK